MLMRETAATYEWGTGGPNNQDMPGNKPQCTNSILSSCRQCSHAQQTPPTANRSLLVRLKTPTQCWHFDKLLWTDAVLVRWSCDGSFMFSRSGMGMQPNLETRWWCWVDMFQVDGDCSQSYDVLACAPTNLVGWQECRAAALSSRSQKHQPRTKMPQECRAAAFIPSLCLSGRNWQCPGLFTQQITNAHDVMRMHTSRQPQDCQLQAMSSLTWVSWCLLTKLTRLLWSALTLET